MEPLVFADRFDDKMKITDESEMAGSPHIGMFLGYCSYPEMLVSLEEVKKVRDWLDNWLKVKKEEMNELARLAEDGCPNVEKS